MNIFTYEVLGIKIYIGGVMEYISQNVAICSLGTVCPCLYITKSVINHVTI